MEYNLRSEKNTCVCVSPVSWCTVHYPHTQSRHHRFGSDHIDLVVGSVWVPARPPPAQRVTALL